MTHLNIDTKQDVTHHPMVENDLEQMKLIQHWQAMSEAFFSRITHLQILGGISPNDPYEDIFEQFGSLTHLCVPSVGVKSPVVNNAVKRNPEVVVIILLNDPPTSEPPDSESDPYILRVFEPSGALSEALDSIHLTKNRKNIVGLYCRELMAVWESGARGGEDMWTLAEKVIRNRS
ncbi:hypothetical protein BDN72DRAFT_862359 [Pluteus cervinus]|uniref:Uncharacterized protein n=1 Tax=Pluteus cervinus TaxID=181527 RepID=A0ACD3ABZ5_9AGAR|nr:hypothetical protein BDN72DRAFT_862359 [Pluteus cervinus]